MPAANIHVLAGRPRPVLKELLREFTRAYADVLDAPLDRVQVWITEVDPELTAVGGVPADELLETADRSSIEVPFARLVMVETRPIEQVERAIAELTSVIARVLGGDPDRVRVEAQSIAAERWGIGGVPFSVRRRADIEASEAQLR